MWFWIIASLIILVVGMFLTLALLRGREEGDSTAAYDLQVYRDQLKTADRDLARGVVSAEDAERIKVEISRRILAADKALQAESHGQQAPLGLNVAVLGIGAAVLLGGIGIYLSLGAPGYGDRPLQLRIEQAREIKKNRPSQADAEARMPQNSAKIDPRDQELIEKLREKVAERADDVKAQTLLAGTEAALGNYRAAYEARKRVITLKGNQANARDYAELADAMIMAANGFVSPEAETALKQALNRDPKHGTALYYTGLMFAQNGRPDIAFNIWSELLERSRPNDPWVRPIRSQIKEAAAWAGVWCRIWSISCPSGSTAKVARPGNGRG